MLQQADGMIHSSQMDMMIQTVRRFPACQDTLSGWQIAMYLNTFEESYYNIRIQ